MSSTLSAHGRKVVAMAIAAQMKPKTLPCGLTRSELFTIYNRLKWAAKRAGNEKLIMRLNSALGILQSNDYYIDEPKHPRTSYLPTTGSCGCKDWEWRFSWKRAYVGACKHMLAEWITVLALDYRESHRLPAHIHTPSTWGIHTTYDNVEIRRTS